MAYVFLSHSHSDKPFARKLAADLRANGHSVWIDEAEINIGDSLVEKIRTGIDEVDYVCAILSKNSIESAWVQKELDIATNREIDEKKVVVLPLLIDDVPLPGFIKGKFYGDFRDEAEYEKQFNLLLRSIKGSKKGKSASKDEIVELRAALRHAQEQLRHHHAAARRAERVALLVKSERLQAQIAAANVKFPEHAPINNTYAFEVGDTVITLDYLLWAVAKAMRRGGHPLDALITLYGKWADAESMLEAYVEMRESEN